MQVRIAIAALCLLTGCTNPRAELDSLVEEVWLDLNQDRQADAVAYLGGGGRYYDTGAPGDGEVDRTVILPLMKRLKDEFEAHPFIHIDDAGHAWVICVQLPASSGARSGIARAVEEADEQFAGSIEAEWGNRWLVLSFGEEEKFEDP